MIDIQEMRRSNRQSVTKKTVHSRRLRARGRALVFDFLEERTMLSITIAALGDSLTDEYQFYAPYRTAAENWPEILSNLRPSQVDFGAFSSTAADRGQTRNQGYAQDWALQGATAQGENLLGYGTTFAEEYEGGSSPGLPGLLTQPGGISNVNVVNILIGGNDYFRAVEQSVELGLNLSNFLNGKITALFEQANAGIVEALQTVVPLIEAANPDTHIIIDTTPSIASTPIIHNLLAGLLTPAEANIVTGFINTEVNNLDYDGSPSGSTPVYESIEQFASSNNLGYLDANGLLNSFIANPTINGVYINPNAAGPAYTDMFVGDGIHPGTIAQAVLTNAIISQIDSWYPGAVTPLTDTEILQLAQSAQPQTTANLGASATNTATGQSITFTVQVPTFPANYETSPSPPAEAGLIDYPAATGLVTFVDASDGNKILATEQLNASGVATFSTAGLGVGLHEIQAIYSGDAVYPPATAQPMWIAVGSTKQVRLLRFVETFQQNITDQISPSRIKRWLTWLDRGVRPRIVARAVVKWVYFHTHLPPGGKIAAGSNVVNQADIRRH